MKRIGLTFLFLATLTSAALAGTCDYPDQTASDGSRCGGRAASERPGGK